MSQLTIMCEKILKVLNWNVEERETILVPNEMIAFCNDQSTTGLRDEAAVFG